MDKFKLAKDGLIKGLRSKESAIEQLETFLSLLLDEEEENELDIAVANKCYLLNKILDYLIPCFEKEGSKTECINTLAVCEFIFRDNFERMVTVILENNPDESELISLWYVLQIYQDTLNNPNGEIYGKVFDLVKKIDSVPALIEILKRTQDEKEQVRIFSLLKTKDLFLGYWEELGIGWYFDLTEKVWSEISTEIFKTNDRKNGIRICFKFIKNLKDPLPQIPGFVEFLSDELYKISNETKDLILILCMKIKFLHYQDELCNEIGQILINKNLDYQDLRELYENDVFMITEGLETVLERDYKMGLEDAIVELVNLDQNEQIKEDVEEAKEDPFTHLYIMYKEKLEEENQNKLLDSAKLGLNLDISKN